VIEAVTYLTVEKGAFINNKKTTSGKGERGDVLKKWLRIGGLKGRAEIKGDSWGGVRGVGENEVYQRAVLWKKYAEIAC